MDVKHFFDRAMIVMNIDGGDGEVETIGGRRRKRQKGGEVEIEDDVDDMDWIRRRQIGTTVQARKVHLCQD